MGEKYPLKNPRPREPGYSNQDGRPDTWDDICLTNRSFAVALGYILNENEGILVELVKQPDWPEEPFGRFIVYKEGGFVKTKELEPGELEDHPPGQPLIFIEDDAEPG